MRRAQAQEKLDNIEDAIEGMVHFLENRILCEIVERNMMHPLHHISFRYCESRSFA
jgi:hypothetical protein